MYVANTDLSAVEPQLVATGGIQSLVFKISHGACIFNQGISSSSTCTLAIQRPNGRQGGLTRTTTVSMDPDTI